MEIKNELYPVTVEQLAAMKEPGPEGPIVMINLLKFREQAVYEDGSDGHLTVARRVSGMPPRSGS